jgi:phosphoribosylanthranilate isomerase
MSVISPIQVKICCVQSPEEARLALQFGAAAVGMVSGMPSGPGEIGLDRIAGIVASVPSAVGTFLLTSGTEVAALVEKQRSTGVNTLQLWDRLASDDYDHLRRALPGVSLVQVIHVRDSMAEVEAREIAPRVDAVVLDSGNPAVPHRWVSGTGQTHDWTISQRIVEELDRPVLLAGGLTSHNVADAIRLVRPYGVDTCTGVRTDDRLDKSKLVAFLESVQRVSP